MQHTGPALVYDSYADLKKDTDNPDLDVSVAPLPDTDPQSFETPEKRLFYYDKSGKIFATDEVLRARKIENTPE